MAATAGVPGASFRQSRSLIPGTSVTYTFIEWQNVDGKLLSGRTQDPGTTILQLRVRDVTALTAKLKAAGVPVSRRKPATPTKFRVAVGLRPPITSRLPTLKEIESCCQKERGNRATS
jgi:hypothetical protein